MDAGSIIAVGIVAVVFILALLNSTMGLGGGASYAAIIILFGMPLFSIKPIALTLNIIVSFICTVRFYRAGWFPWNTFWRFAIASVPFSLMGSVLKLPELINKSVVAVILVCAAFRWFYPTIKSQEKRKNSLAPIFLALPIGALIGFLSGVVGMGSGIILSQVVLLTGWSRHDEMRALTAAFVLLNSTAALVPQVPLGLSSFDNFLFWIPAVLLGAWIGTELSDHSRLIIIGSGRLLSLLLIVAAIRLIV